MPFDGFLKIDGIKGECKDSKHKDEIDVLSFSYGVTQSTSIATGGGLTAGKSSLGAFSFNQTYHKGSVPLYVYCATGKHIDNVVFTARKSAGDNQLEYLVIKFESCLITSVQTMGGSENDRSRVTSSVFRYPRSTRISSSGRPERSCSAMHSWSWAAVMSFSVTARSAMGPPAEGARNRERPLKDRGSTFIASP